MIERSYVEKIIRKHGIATHSLCLIEAAITSGAALSDGPHHLVFLYEDKHLTGGFVKVAVKSDRTGEKLLVCTFHKLRASEHRRKMKNATLLRAPA